MIGAHFNPEQVAALQALANICHEGQCASYDSLAASVRDHRNTNAIGDHNLDAEPLKAKLKELYEEIAPEGVVEFVTHKGKPHVRLTQDGYRCNLITVM